jgi:hypothetical protein
VASDCACSSGGVNGGGQFSYDTAPEPNDTAGDKVSWGEKMARDSRSLSLNSVPFKSMKRFVRREGLFISAMAYGCPLKAC